jgi:hypothetical protein
MQIGDQRDGETDAQPFTFCPRGGTCLRVKGLMG